MTSHNFTFIKYFSTDKNIVKKKYQRYIPILLPKQFNLNKLIIGVLDIETFNYRNILIPYAIGIYVLNNKLKNHEKQTYLNISLLHNFYKKSNKGINFSLKMASLNMLKSSILNFINNMPKSTTIYIYAHNLGSFDGYLIFNTLYSIYGTDLKILMDNENKFIEIKFENIILRDSYRILPASLKDLATLVPGCKLKINFNHQETNFDKVIKDCSFIVKYLTNDLIITYKVIIHFAELLYNAYRIRFTDLYSASNLAFIIYRTGFYKGNIPLLHKNFYKLLKESYYGGGFYIKSELKIYSNLYYYDVNSLYPYCMLNDMPGKFLKYIINITIKEFLNQDLFGFFYCVIDIPEDIEKPIVISRDPNTNVLCYPRNQVQGLYFSEEIKNWIKKGYNVKILKGFEFERIQDVFKPYVLTFYHLKMKYNNFSERFIYKILLNGLYGYLGRSPDKYKIEIVNNETFFNFIRFFEYKNAIHLSKDKVLLKYMNNLRNNVDKEDLLDYYDNYKEKQNNFKIVFSNIAIASAITAYARIFMSDFYNDDLIYSDTDSIIVKSPLKDKYIGKNLGQFKLESKIKELYIYKHKIYAYKDYNNKVVIKSAGIPTNIFNLNHFKKRILYNTPIQVVFDKIISSIYDMSLKIQKFNIKM